MNTAGLAKTVEYTVILFQRNISEGRVSVTYTVSSRSDIYNVGQNSPPPQAMCFAPSFLHMPPPPAQMLVCGAATV